MAARNKSRLTSTIRHPHTVILAVVVVIVAFAGVYMFAGGRAFSLVSSESPSFNVSAAEKVAKGYSTGKTKVGLSLYNSNGTAIVNYNSTAANYGASITKSMILIAYLKQVGAGTLSATATTEMTSMIEISDNTSANWVYDHITNGPTAINAVAKSAGMTGFVFNTSDPVYVLGQSKVTAKDFARFFANIDTKFSAAHKSFALEILSHTVKLDQNGLLKSGLPGTVYSKEGWKPENTGYEGAPYVVDQAAQFSEDGQKYGVAVTVAGTATETSGETIVQKVVSALVH
jgi:hypothetical protein